MRANDLSMALSLVSVPQLSTQDYLLLSGARNFNSFALAPSHLSDTFPSMNTLDIQEKARRFQEIGLRASSLQGLFFGLDFPTRKNIKDRVKFLVLASMILGCNFWVLGAPNLRKNEFAWNWITEEMQQVEESFKITVSLENICIEPCSSDLNHVWKNYNKFSSLTLDYANAISCQSISWGRFGIQSQINHLHLSGKAHSKDLHEDDLLAISKLWKDSKEPMCSIEISESRLIPLLDSAEKMADQLKHRLQFPPLDSK